MQRQDRSGGRADYDSTRTTVFCLRVDGRFLLAVPGISTPDDQEGVHGSARGSTPRELRTRRAVRYGSVLGFPLVGLALPGRFGNRGHTHSRSPRFGGDMVPGTHRDQRRPDSVPGTDRRRHREDARRGEDEAGSATSNFASVIFDIVVTVDAFVVVINLNLSASASQNNSP